MNVTVAPRTPSARGATPLGAGPTLRPVVATPALVVEARGASMAVAEAA